MLPDGSVAALPGRFYADRRFTRIAAADGAVRVYFDKTALLLPALFQDTFEQAGFLQRTIGCLLSIGAYSAFLREL